MNGDGQLDVVALEGTAVVVWLRNDGGFDNALSVPASAGGMGIADFTGDGRPDVATTNALYGSAGGPILANTCQ
jgi:hypothetical protein